MDMGGASVLFMGCCRDNDRMRHMDHPPLEGHPYGEGPQGGGKHDQDAEEEEEDNDGVGSDEEEDEYSQEGEDEDAMSWASFSLPAHMYRIVQLLESSYDAPISSDASVPVGSLRRHCITYADLVALSGEEEYSENEVSNSINFAVICFCRHVFTSHLSFLQIIATLTTLHSESLLTVFLASTDAPPPAPASKHKRAHKETGEDSKGKRKKQK